MRLKEIKPDMVIHCNTEEERFSLINHIDNQGGFRWRYTGDSPATKKFSMPYLIVGSDRKITQSPTDNVGINITEFSDLIIPELSAKEVLEIMGEICNSVQCDRHCPTWNYCSHKEFGRNAEEAIEICAKWREENPKEEKKELETEWVYVVRIIKVHDNGKKECVYEIDAFASSDDVDSPFSESEELAERELKDYVANHEGNFFATLEHICRIKE